MWGRERGEGREEVGRGGGWVSEGRWVRGRRWVGREEVGERREIFLYVSRYH